MASLAAGFILSESGPLLSYDHTETRLLVTLCVAAWTRHGPTSDLGSDLVRQHTYTYVDVLWKVGVSCGAGNEAPAFGELDEVELDGPGVDERLPEPNPGSEVIEEEPPML